MGTITARPIMGLAAWHGQRPGALDRLDPSDLGRRRRRARRRAGRRQGPRFSLARHPARGLPSRPGFGAELAAVGHELEHGRGVVLLRGLPVARYTEDELRQLYWGIGTHLGAARYQNAHGELIGEVRDELRAYGAVNQPGVTQQHGTPVTSRYKARSSGPLRFHTDRADVVGLLCVRQARARRHQQDRQLGRDQQRDPRAAARPARAPPPGLLPHARGRGARRRPALVRAPGLRRPRRAIHEPVLAHVRRGGPAHPRDPAASPRRRTRRSICWRRSPKSCASRWSFERATSSS